MTGLAFDTLKAAKALRVAGFDERQAEAVVATIGDAVDESLVTKADLQQALRPLVTQEGLDKALEAQDKRFNDRLETRLESMALKADLAEALQPMMTKADLAGALQPMMTKADLAEALLPMATKKDVLLSQQRTTILLGTMMATGIVILAAIDGLS